MGFTTPPDKASGDTVTEANWDTHIKANLDFLHSPPMCQVVSGTAWAFSGAGDTTLTFGTADEQFDTDSMHGTANSSRITVQTAGKYLVCSNTGTVTTTSALWTTSISVNGTPVAATPADVASGGDGQGASASILWNAGTGDYFEMKFSLQNAGIVSLSRPSLSANWIGG